MKETEFEQRYSPLWLLLEALLEAGRGDDKVPDEHFPEQYRQVCGHLSMARQRDYSDALVSRLNRLVMLGHHRLYQRDSRATLQRLGAALATFLIALRQQRRYVLCSALLFILPALVMGVGAYLSESFTYSMLSPDQAAELEAMYDPGNARLGAERDSETDLFMFGYYISHNIGIAFKAFAGGIFLGLGTVAVVLFNGLYLGAVTGYLTRVGLGVTFYPFVIGHGAFELTAIVICGAAGLMIGHALIHPGRWGRLDALRQAASEAVKLMYGGVFMLFVAAFLEAFWSSSSQLPVAVKLSVGALFWLSVLWFCFFSSLGTRREPR
ncbi:MAG: stage II sporulation protein M [Oceanospirillales bacterium]|uniref:Putative membrane protein SpoIIM required for sporulation n=1 Tax=Marinobacterium halophilum TaxID=267374 RepID=A0A2P8EXF5_9GAMM|nr:stage II sporulation protein M [Marinobacterium halophilum]MBR9829343.1 stage II sporulation protein M [Oceanospirillales bacterium]PSL14143.1 putative membrane protein SpoIIM required for sporulation [Marinobacterium halophilum]